MKKQYHDNETKVKPTSKQINKIKDQTDYQKLDSMDDSKIDYSDIPETDVSFWANGEVVEPGSKKAISLRVDEDILNWFKRKEGRYQRLINQVLSQYMNAQKNRRRK